MDISTRGLDVLFIAGFGPVPRNVGDSKALYQETLGLPIKPMEGNEDYLLAEHGALDGAQSCFGTEVWPADIPAPQSWIEFEVADLDSATRVLREKGYALLVENRLEPWGQSITRFLSPEGILVGLSITPWLRD